MNKKPAKSNTKEQPKSDLVLTPGGWRPRSKVHYLENGQHISGKGGRLRILETATGRVIKDLGPTSKKKRPEHLRRAVVKTTKTVPGLSDKGWIENSQWQNTGTQPIVYFSTTWVVPPVPASDDDQVIFLFSGLTPADLSHILQPVLQWGAANGTGKIWSITNWYANGQGGTSITWPPIQVNAGDVLQGVITLTGQSSTGFSYHCSFVGHTSVDIDANDVAELTWAYETLEAYGSQDETQPVPQCADYPNTPLAAFYDIEIKTGASVATGTDATLNWSTVTNFTDCGQQVVIVSNDSPGGAVYLYYRSLIQTLYFVADKSTFGKDEVTDIIAKGGTVPNAFWLVLEGFTIQQLSIDQPSPLIPVLSGPFNSISGIKIVPGSSGTEYERPGDTYTPQRIRFSYDIQFSSDALNAFPTSDETDESLSAGIKIGANALDAEMVFELVAGADPYFTNIDPANNNVSYLSQDLRVFSASEGNSPVPGCPAFTSDPYASIQSLVQFLNSNSSYTSAMPGTDPLNALPGQAGFETGDSSVTPFNSSGGKNYNFAVARVRLQDAGGAVAPNVRVFFRLFVAQSCDTDYQPSTTYKSQLGTSGPNNGKPVFPLPSGTGLTDPSGQGIQTVPFFATDVSGTHDYDGTNSSANIRDITISVGQDKVWAYFGCFLDVYDSNNQSIFAGTHHCIVAEIAYDDAPIRNSNGVTMSPENSDKLAQRNLQITSSGNPSYPVTHRIPQAFDLRPSPAFNVQSGLLEDYPDELMIDWDNLPAGSVAHFYWPQVSAHDVSSLASKLYGANSLSVSDANTITCKTTEGVTYIPIPSASGINVAGLFTVDLPSTIHLGQEFNIVVRRISSRQLNIGYVAGVGDRATSESSRNGSAITNWRYITGAFQVRIPVDSDATLLLPEENTLAILKWRLQHVSLAYRWYPVLQRYISYVSSRVDGFGGNAAAVVPSLEGIPGTRKPHGNGGQRRIAHLGKVTALIHDRFGDFEGFILDTREGNRRFSAREPEIEQVVNRAWAERILITVIVELHAPHRLEEILLHCPPKPFTR